MYQNTFDSQNKTQRTIFVRNVTVLDCAVLFPDVGPRGRSWHVDVEWTGTTDNEGVVVDFGTAKKLAKSHIDQFYDHRLWVNSQCFIKNDSDRIIVKSNCNSDDFNGVFALSAPLSAVTVIENSSLSALSFEDNLPDLGTEGVANQIAKTLLAVSPKNVSAIKVTLRTTDDAKGTHRFAYTHSLKQHDGNCQRFHGHSNIVEIFQNNKFSPLLSEQCASQLKNRYLINRSYIQENPATDAFLLELVASLKGIDVTNDHAFVRYDGNQGEVAIIVPRKMVCLLPEESTIENIANFMHTLMNLSETSHKVFAYEGLAKGSVFP